MHKNQTPQEFMASLKLDGTPEMTWEDVNSKLSRLIAKRMLAKLIVALTVHFGLRLLIAHWEKKEQNA